MEHPDEPDLFESNRIKGMLDPTRSFGDFKHKIQSADVVESMTTPTSKWSPPYITCDPEITIHRLTPKDKYLIMATDGLWEKFTNNDVIDMLADAVQEGKGIPTRMIEKFISKTTGGLEEDKLSVLFAMNPRARRALHDDVTIVEVEFDVDALAAANPDISSLFSTFEFTQSPLMSQRSNPKLVDITQLLSQIPHDSENSDYH
jgi:pyruvate dehydrogenase phosphatase